MQGLAAGAGHLLQAGLHRARRTGRQQRGGGDFQSGRTCGVRSAHRTAASVCIAFSCIWSSVKDSCSRLSVGGRASPRVFHSGPEAGNCKEIMRERPRPAIRGEGLHAEEVPATQRHHPRQQHFDPLTAAGHLDHTPRMAQQLRQPPQSSSTSHRDAIRRSLPARRFPGAPLAGSSRISSSSPRLPAAPWRRGVQANSAAETYSRWASPSPSLDRCERRPCLRTRCRPRLP
jgi:hypothetical protein